MLNASTDACAKREKAIIETSPKNTSRFALRPILFNPSNG
jgi:hypothetical protein